MTQQELAEKYTQAAEEFNRHENRQDGSRVAGSLDGGLTVLRDALYLRLHEDVERIVGTDSILMPVSEKKAEAAAKAQIELFQIAESAAAARQFGCLRTDDAWYLQWLARLRLGQSPADPGPAQRLADYLSKTPDDRRLKFTDVLARTLPESRRAPLVLFRLVPLAVQLVTALAFGDHPGASRLRALQEDCLPAIGACRHCRGKILENGQQCPECGNPLWKSEWLIRAD